MCDYVAFKMDYFMESYILTFHKTMQGIADASAGRYTLHFDKFSQRKQTTRPNTSKSAKALKEFGRKYTDRDNWTDRLSLNTLMFGLINAFIVLYKTVSESKCRVLLVIYGIIF